MKPFINILFITLMLLSSFSVTAQTDSTTTSATTTNSLQVSTIPTEVSTTSESEAGIDVSQLQYNYNYGPQAVNIPQEGFAQTNLLPEEQLALSNIEPLFSELNKEELLGLCGETNGVELITAKVMDLVTDESLASLCSNLEDGLANCEEGAQWCEGLKESEGQGNEKGIFGLNVSLGELCPPNTDKLYGLCKERILNDQQKSKKDLLNNVQEFCSQKYADVLRDPWIQQTCSGKEIQKCPEPAKESPEFYDKCFNGGGKVQDKYDDKGCYLGVSCQGSKESVCPSFEELQRKEKACGQDGGYAYRDKDPNSGCAFVKCDYQKQKIGSCPFTDDIIKQQEKVCLDTGGKANVRTDDYSQCKGLECFCPEGTTSRWEYGQTIGSAKFSGCLKQEQPKFCLIGQHYDELKKLCVQDSPYPTCKSDEILCHDYSTNKTECRV
ncbi:MAG: hypothetical protein Q7K42_03625, partial [Candidatus Diapherotrites archaeon]|nr:hypothetical protein [Candidatus Diapherotrites archaeon]